MAGSSPLQCGYSLPCPIARLTGSTLVGGSLVGGANVVMARNEGNLRHNSSVSVWRGSGASYSGGGDGSGGDDGSGGGGGGTLRKESSPIVLLLFSSSLS